MMAPFAEELDATEPEAVDVPKSRAVWELDPGWIMGGLMPGQEANPLELVANSRWWPASHTSGPIGEILDRLWRHSVAISLGARSLARESGDPDPDALARAGLFCRLGWWAIAAVDPEWLARWWNEQSPNARRRRERADLGTDLSDLGRRLAEAWGCDDLVVESAWLHRDPQLPLHDVATEPKRLALVQEAYRWAEQTPWSFDGRPAREAMPSDPRLRILIAEVQSRTGGAFGAGDATIHEERMTRQNASLRLRLAASNAARSSSTRFLEALADSRTDETAQEWSERAAKSWCCEAGVTASRIVWVEPASRTVVENSEAAPRNGEAAADVPPGDRRAPSVVLPLSIHGRTKARLELWCDASQPGLEQRLAARPEWAAWQAWATNLFDRALLERRLQATMASLRNVVETEDTRLRQQKLAALAEFAAGAGHEINNPLAVVVGRAQLLLTRSEDPESTRSLQIILDQALRAHRILRDLIFVARPPVLRRRKCRPAEILQMCLRGFQGECESRGIRLSDEIGESEATMVADPEALNHLAQILLRNAIQSTPNGGKIEVRSRIQNDELLWSFSDSGKGITPTEGAHLFDPFFSGRQAGRGLGLGLPRAARFLELAGGHVRWTSNLGHGAAFHVHLPLAEMAERGDPSARASSDSLERI
jgi:signal transduction histidine kinase